MDRTSDTARTEALGDMLDALNRLAHAGAFDTMTGKQAAYDVMQGVRRLALQACDGKLVDELERLMADHGI